MFLLLSAAISLLLFFLNKKIQSPFILKALPAYSPKKRLPKGRKNLLPDDIPKFYY